jgi:hypothetical protein
MLRPVGFQKMLFLLASGLLLVTFSFSSSVSASPKNAPAITVKPSQIAVRGSSVCGYVKTGKQKKPSWQSGSRVSSTKFRPHAAEVLFLSKSVKSQNGLLRKAKARKNKSEIQKLTKSITASRARLKQVRARASVAKSQCKKLTSIRYNTKGVVALAVVKERPKTSKKTSKKKKTIKKKLVSSSIIDANTDLIGLLADGTVQEVLEPVDPGTGDTSNLVNAMGTYQAPDGSIVFTHFSHPDKCLLARIPLEGGIEECLVSSTELPNYFVVGDSAGFDAVQFDDVGGIYFTARTTTTSCATPGVPASQQDVFRLHDGVLQKVPFATCQRPGFWRAISTGGVVISTFRLTGPGVSDTYRIVAWDLVKLTTLMEDVQISNPVGLQSFANGDVLIQIFNDESNDKRWSGGRQSQGMTYRFNAETGLKPWWHYEDQDPEYSSESIANVFCNCDAQLPLMRKLLRAGNDLYGVGYIGGNTQHIFQLYPKVERLAFIGGAGNEGQVDFFTKTDDWFIVGGRDYFGIFGDPNYWSKISQPPINEIRAVHATTGQQVVLHDPSAPVGLFSVIAAPSGNTATLNGVRVSDGQFVLGIFDGTGATPTLNWIETEPLEYQQISVLYR